MTNNYTKYYERKVLAEKIFDNNGKLTIEKRVSDAGRTTYYIVGKQEKLYNAGIHNATKFDDCSFFEKLISKKVAENLVSSGKAKVFDYDTVKKYLQFSLHDLRYFIISNYPTKTKSIQTRTRAASDLTDIKEELAIDNNFNALHTYNDNFRTPNNPWGKVPALGGRIIDIYGETVAYFDACGKFMSPLFQIEDDAEFSQTFEYDCWVSPEAIDVATEAEEAQAAAVDVKEYRVEYLVWFRKEKKAKIVIEENPEFIANDEAVAFPRKYNLHNDDVSYKGFVLTDKKTGELVNYYMAYSRFLDTFFEWLPKNGEDDTSCHATAKIVDNILAAAVENTAISELVTLIADAGYTVPETIINGADKQATLEHLTIIAEAAGVIEPLELCK